MAAAMAADKNNMTTTIAADNDECGMAATMAAEQDNVAATMAADDDER